VLVETEHIRGDEVHKVQTRRLQKLGRLKVGGEKERFQETSIRGSEVEEGGTERGGGGLKGPKTGLFWESQKCGGGWEWWGEKETEDLW